MSEGLVALSVLFAFALYLVGYLHGSGGRVSHFTRGMREAQKIHDDIYGSHKPPDPDSAKEGGDA